ncbi:MAG: Dabb family protein [Bacteroidales bacterium]|nr:Dabb family protein [Bacteroidales bacterium]
MVRHLVMWKLLPSAEGNQSHQNAAIIREKLLSLNDKIPVIRDLKVNLALEGCPYSNFDLLLEVLFDDYKGLETYQQHPEHLAVGGFVRKVTESRACVDYEI